MPHGERSCGKSATAIDGSCAVAWSKHTASNSAQIRTDVSAGFNRPIDGVSALNVPPFCRLNLPTSGHRQRSETIRGRFGYAADNVLFYATGGFAWSNAQFVRTQLTGALNSATAGTDEAVNKGLMGWVAGGGIAYAFAQNWNVFAEYRHTSFGSSSFSLPFSQLTTTSTTTVSTVELGLNYNFTSGGQLTGVPLAPYPALSPALVYKSPPGRHTYDWAGIYFGADGGFGWTTFNGTLLDAIGTPLLPSATA